MANLKDVHIFDDGVYLLELQPLEVKLCKPLNIGVVCLELAKVFMTRYHYRVVGHFGRKKVILLYTDTDSFIYLFLLDDLYESLMYFRDDFDFSSYPSNHPLHNTENRFCRGKWKDEMNGKVIEEVVFLRSKCYSLKITGSDTSEAKAAGVKRAAQKSLTHENYRDALFNSQSFYVNQSRIGSKNHQLFTYVESKRALNSFDDKRYQMNKYKTLPYGHYLLNF